MTTFAETVNSAVWGFHHNNPDYATTLKPGDEVAVVTKHHGSVYRVDITKVKSVSPKAGLITLVDSKIRFNPTGYKYMDYGGSYVLTPVLPELRKWLEWSKAMTTIQQTDFKTMDYLKVIMIAGIIKNEIPTIEQINSKGAPFYDK